MQTLIYKELSFQFPPHHTPSDFFLSKTGKNHNDSLRTHKKEFHYTLNTVKLCSATAPQSLSYGGWDDFQLADDPCNSGESNQFYNLLSSIGIGDKKYASVYLFGFVCALAISRVKISTIIVFPASAIVFALGFSVGLVKGGHVKEVKLNEMRKKIIDENVRSVVEKLGNLGENLEGCNAEVLNLMDDIKSRIECNQVTVSDLEGYINVLESADINLRNTLDLVKCCVQIILGGSKENEIVPDHDSNKRRKKPVDKVLNFSRYFDGLFGWKFGGPKPGKVSSKIKLNDVEDQKHKKIANILAAPVENVNMNSVRNGDSENKRQSTIRAKKKIYGTEMERIAFESDTKDADEMNDYTTSFFDKSVHSYRNKTSKFVNDQKVHFKDYQDGIETVSSHSNSYDSLDVSISMNHTVSSFGSDLEFNRYLSEANNLMKEAKVGSTEHVDEIRAEVALRNSAVLLSKAIEMRPMSLLAMGQLGNTCLLHGELKLKMSRDLRSLLAGKILNKFDHQFSNKEEITSALVNICEECDELLIKAGRKYKLALSIDGSDFRALYNWGLALTFRAQLIADIGPNVARDADKIFLAAIDKFDEIMSKSNVYAPDVLFRWGEALQHRSRLRPNRSREKVKLLQQAKRLYEDALVMDSGNRPLQEALSSCMSELDDSYR